MDISAAEILKVVGGEPLGAWNEALGINKISTDTRTLEKDDAFFALRGSRFDGHDFISEAFAKGARNFIVSDGRRVPPDIQKTTPVILVADTLKAYGDLAKAYRQKFKIPAVAVTGSVGKTTVKELVSHLLSGHFLVLKNRGTENNLVGVPRTILQLEPRHELLVLEMGTSAPGEIDRLASILAPQIGVVTQIGHSHLSGLEGLEGVKAEKLSLIRHVERGGILVINGEDPNLHGVSSGVHKVLRAGFSKETQELAAERIQCDERGCAFKAGGIPFETQLIGRHNVLNCLLAMLVVRALGKDFSSLRKDLASFKAVPGRLTLKSVEGIRFIDDSYNSNPVSFRAALAALEGFKSARRKGVVCGDMLELGEQAESLHRELGAAMARSVIDFIIAAGPFSRGLVDEAVKSGFDSKKIFHVSDSYEAGRLCREVAAPGDVVLIKGSRGLQMEKVFECFITSSTR